MPPKGSKGQNQKHSYLGIFRHNSKLLKAIRTRVPEAVIRIILFTQKSNEKH